MTTIRVADFSPFPGGRFKADGPHSGEQFRDEVLVPSLSEAIRISEVLSVELDGTKGYGSSFLEEAFGGLIRTGVINRSQARRHLQIIAKDKLYEPYRKLAERYLDNARPYAAAS